MPSGLPAGGTFLPKLYCVWATLAIASSIALAGLSAESITRLLVLAFLLAQVVFRRVLTSALPGLAPRTRFIVLGTVLACVVEGFHMISTPVFRCLRIEPGTSLSLGATYYAVDLVFTIPAYVVIFSVIWRLITRIDFGVWRYTFDMGLAQALGDGGLLFFLASPPMLFFLPYPMTNYHAINVLPFLAVKDTLPARRVTTWRRLVTIPVVVLTYFICGTLIKVAGKRFGLE